MTKRYYITPYSPIHWSKDREADTEPYSDLQVSFLTFAHELQQVWKEVEIAPPTSWQIIQDGTPGVAGAFWGFQNQILALEIGLEFTRFVVWYRSFVSSRYRLFLFREGGFENLELTSKTNISDVINFIGIQL